MDEFTDNIFSPSLWEDGDAKEKSSWCYIETGQPNALLPTSLRLHENDKEILPLNLICSKENVEGLSTQDFLTVEPDGGANYALGNGLIFEEGQNCIDKVTLLTKGSLKMENIGMQYDRVLPAVNPLNLNYSKQLPVFGHLTSSRSFDESNCIGHYGSEKFEYQRSFKDSQHSSSMPQLWPSASYDGVSSLSAVIGQDTTQQFDQQEGNLRDDMNYMGQRYVSMDPIPQLDASIALKDEENLQSYALSSFTTGSNTAMAMNGASSLPQNASAVPSSGCNGTGKPRVRARRGHATDPHSIAERLRREKIAERMKSLQELVPDSSKVDKASMLDEIIEYVKFLQLQVKVLSMSRLGGAGAVVPLLTDFQAQGSNRMSLSPSARMAIDAAPSPDQMAFEQEVLKLMESNVTTAIQYLQGKGLCLMPMALAAAISSGEATLSRNISDEKKNICLENELVHINKSGSHSNSSSSSCSFSGVEACQKTSH